MQTNLGLLPDDFAVSVIKEELARIDASRVLAVLIAGGHAVSELDLETAVLAGFISPWIIRSVTGGVANNPITKLIDGAQAALVAWAIKQVKV